MLVLGMTKVFKKETCKEQKSSFGKKWLGILVKKSLEGTVSRDFLLQIFVMNHEKIYLFFLKVSNQNHLELPISQRILEKIRNYPNWILRGLGETDT